MTYVLGAKGKMLPSVTRCFEIRRSRIRYSFFHIMFPTPPMDLGVNGQWHIPNFGWLCNFHQLLLNSPMENGVKSKVVFVLEKRGPGGMLSYVVQNASSSMSLFRKSLSPWKVFEVSCFLGTFLRGASPALRMKQWFCWWHPQPQAFLHVYPVMNSVKVSSARQAFETKGRNAAERRGKSM